MYQQCHISALHELSYAYVMQISTIRHSVLWTGTLVVGLTAYKSFGIWGLCIFGTPTQQHYSHNSGHRRNTMDMFFY